MECPHLWRLKIRQIDFCCFIRYIHLSTPLLNLDLHNAERLHDLFAELATDRTLGVVVVTHNPSLAARAARTLLLEGGRLVDTQDRGMEG